MIILLLLIDIFTVLVQKAICDKLLPQKERSYLFTTAVWITFLLLSALSTYIMSLSIFLNALIFCILLFCVLSLLYKCSLGKSLMLTAFIYVLGMGSEFFVFLIGYAFGIDIQLLLIEEDGRLMCAVISKLIWFSFAKVTILIWRKRQDVNVKIQDWVEALFIPLSSILIAASLVNPQEQYGGWIKLCAACLLLFFNLFLFYLYDRVQQNALDAAEQNYVRLQIEHYARMNEEIGQYWQKLRDFKHDLKQRYLLEQTYLQQGAYEKLESYYEESLDILRGDKLIADTGNRCIDNIINYKAMAAMKDHISIKVNLRVACDITFDEKELYSLLGNLIDNSLEAVRPLPKNKRIISLQLVTQDNNMLIEVSNPFEGTRIKNKSGYQTTKPHAKEHGIGLKIIESIVRKHQGQIVIDSSNQQFTVKVLLFDVCLQ